MGTWQSSLIGSLGADRYLPKRPPRLLRGLGAGLEDFPLELLLPPPSRPFKLGAKVGLEVVPPMAIGMPLLKAMEDKPPSAVPAALPRICPAKPAIGLLPFVRALGLRTRL